MNNGTNLETTLPWVGSYFGIPQPDVLPEYHGKQLFELEIHILRKDLSTRIIKLQYPGINDMDDNGIMHATLRRTCYKDVNSLAHAVYRFEIDPATGARTRRADHGNSFAYRVSGDKWQYFDPKNRNPHMEQEFNFSPFN